MARVTFSYSPHYVYVNGSLSAPTTAGGLSLLQALTPLGNFTANPYPFGPGGRGGDAGSPADPGARIPLYTVP